MTGKTTVPTMEVVFAPYCPTCDARRLLGLSRIVVSHWHEGGPLLLRCTCGTIVDADAVPPERPGLCRPERPGLTAA